MGNIVFIGGAGRTGTTLVRKILEKNSQVFALPFESRFISDPDGIVDFYTSYSANWSPYLADRRIKRLEKFLLDLAKVNPFHKFIGRILGLINKNTLIFSPKAYFDWELSKYIPNFERYVKKLILDLREFAFPAIWRGTESYKFLPKLYYGKPKSKEEVAQILRIFIEKIIQSSFQKKRGAKIYVDDCPWNILIARELFELFPEARIIHVLRDPRDTIASLKNQKWSPKSFKEVVIFLKDIIQQWFVIKSKIPSNKYLEIKLEDLNNSPEVIIKKLCDYLALPYENQMINFDSNKTHVNRWIKDLSEEEKKYIEENFLEIMNKLGYK